MLTKEQIEQAAYYYAYKNPLFGSENSFMALYVLVLAGVEYTLYAVAWWAAWLASGVIFGLLKI